MFEYTPHNVKSLKSFTIYSIIMKGKLKQQMLELSDYIGEKVLVIYFQGGEEKNKEDILEEVEPFSCIKLKESGSIPFLGTGIAIREIDVGEKAVYVNRLPDKSYNWTTSESVRRRCGFPV